VRIIKSLWIGELHILIVRTRVGESAKALAHADTFEVLNHLTCTARAVSVLVSVRYGISCVLSQPRAERLLLKPL
jgi:hypothetical protein